MVKAGFTVSTPTVRVVGVEGALFTVSSVLDGTTIVAVERGVVSVGSLRAGAETFTLTEGRRARFDHRGGGEIDPSPWSNGAQF